MILLHDKIVASGISANILSSSPEFSLLQIETNEGLLVGVLGVGTSLAMNNKSLSPTLPIDIKVESEISLLDI